MELKQPPFQITNKSLHFGTLPNYVPGLVEDLLRWTRNADVCNLCGVSSATANRILFNLVEEKKLVKYCEGGHWAYRFL